MSHSFVRRRLWWKGPNRAEVDFGKTPGSDLVQFHWVKVSSYVAEAEETSWRLFWANEEIDSFATLVALKVWLIKSAYGTQPGHLIPSEILHDANLGYFNVNIWVDAFDTPDPVKAQDFIIVEGVEDIEVPKGRRIHLVADGNSHGGRRRIDPPAPKHRSKVRALTEEIDRITGDYTRKYGHRQVPATYPSRPTPREEEFWEKADRPKKADIYPPRPVDGSSFSPVDLGWQDFSWEARPIRAPKEAEVPDEECFFVLNVENEENP